MNRLPVVLLLPLLLLTACGAKMPGQYHYETTPVSRGDLVQYVTASGSLSAVVSVDVGSQVSGKISALNVDFNSPVKKGDIVAEIDPSLYKAAMRQAEGDLASAKAVVTLKQQNLERKKVLVPQRAATTFDLDQAVAELAQADATVIIKQASLDKAQVDLNYCKITAPVDGIVISRKVDLGQTLAAAMTTPVLFTIAQDITKMHISATVSEADIGQVKNGQEVNFNVDAFPDEVFHGKVVQVRKAPTTTANVVTYETIIDFENPEQKLFPGMTADISILVAERKDVLKVPNTTLRFSPPDGAKFEKAAPAKMQRNQRLVYGLGADPKTLKAAIVRAGITDGVDTEILEGLAESEAVVTNSTSEDKGMPPPPEKKIKMSRPVIQLQDVAKVYRTGEVEVHAVRRVSLEIQSGEFVAVMGASGSGKSTLMNMLGCLDRPTAGAYILDGTNVAALNRRQLATVRNHKLGFVFQSFNLLARTTALENVELPMFYTKPLQSSRVRRERATEALRRVGLADRLHHRPSQLSGGQQQRIAIARALVNQPQLVLADEPTGNLDTRTSIDIMGFFQELNDAGITIVMVTHELDIASYCKRIVVMRDGEVISDTVNEARRLAHQELMELGQAEQKAKLVP